MTSDQLNTLRKMQDMSRRISSMIRNRARKACKEAGLDSGLLGIHPHNAMCAFNNGQPWKGVNYSKVRLCLKLIEKSYEPSEIVDCWYKRVNNLNY